MRLPAAEGGQVLLGDEDQGCVGILQNAVDDDVVVREEAGHRDQPVRGIRPYPVGRVRVGSHLDDLRGVDRRTDGGDVPVGQHAHIVDAVGVQGGDGAAGGRTEPDDGSAQPTAVAAGDADQLHGVQDGAVARQLVVLVKDVQPEPAVGLPVIHRLEGDQRQPPIDGDLGQGGILHAVRPAPDDLSHMEFGEILGLDLGQQDDVAVGDELFPGADSTDEFGQCVVRGAEIRAVAVLEEDPRPDPAIDPAEMRRVNRQSALVRLARASQDPQRKRVAPQRFLSWNKASADEALAAALACLAARFSFRDFPDFLVMVCRGDLSDIAGPLIVGAWLVPIP